MSKLDWAILVLASVSIGIFVAVLVAFYTGVYSPIKYEASNVPPYSKNGLRVAESEPGGVLSLGLEAHNPQETINNSKLQGYFEW